MEPQRLEIVSIHPASSPKITVLLIANPLRKHIVQLLFVEMEELSFRQEEAYQSSHRVGIPNSRLHSLGQF